MSKFKIRELSYAENYERNGEKKTIWIRCGSLFINEENNRNNIRIETV